MNGCYSGWEMLISGLILFCSGGGLGIAAMCIVHMSRSKDE